MSGVSGNVLPLFFCQFAFFRDGNVGWDCLVSLITLVIFLWGFIAIVTYKLFQMTMVAFGNE